MKDPHNHAKVGYSMILVAGSLAAIGIIALLTADDVLFSDNLARDKTAHFNECKINDFVADDCVKYRERINTEASGIYVDPSKWK